jgi:Asp-tRNA(Asn)/Glu-tRNA(Gln) amidotransferase A subunit family amidase
MAAFAGMRVRNTSPTMVEDRFIKGDDPVSAMLLRPPRPAHEFQSMRVGISSLHSRLRTERLPLVLRNTQIANQFGLTAISLPMAAMTLPAGLMLIARGGDDQRLFAIAAAVEEQLKGLN